MLWLDFEMGFAITEVVCLRKFSFQRALVGVVGAKELESVLAIFVVNYVKRCPPIVLTFLEERQSLVNHRKCC